MVYTAHAFGRYKAGELEHDKNIIKLIITDEIRHLAIPQVKVLVKETDLT